MGTRPFGLVAAGYLGLAWRFGEQGFALALGIGLLFPLALIWFADALFDLCGGFQWRDTSWPTPFTASPAWMVRWFGWCLLVMPLVVGVFHRQLLPD